MSLYGFGYRVVMRLAHRFDWHYAPKFGPIAPTGEYQQWCQWCGLRYTTRGHQHGDKLRSGIGIGKAGR